MKVNTKIIALIFILIGILYPKPITTIAVLDLEAKGVSASEASVLTDRLRSELINVGQYIVVDRKNMEEILKEQGFQQSGCTSDECVAEVGQLLGVQFMVSGTVGKFGKTFTIQLQILNIETGVIEQSSNYDYTGEKENLLAEGIQTALLRLIGLEEAPQISLNRNGFLHFDVDPPKSIIDINGKKYKSEEVKQLELAPGLYKVNVSAKYYYPYSKDIQISQNSLLPLKFSLKSGKRDLEKLKRNKKLSTICSIASIGATAFYALLSNSMYDKYLNATTADDAVNYRNSFQTMDKVTIGLSVGALGISTYTILNWNKEKKLKTILGVE